MQVQVIVAIVAAVLIFTALALSIRVVTQYQKGVVFRLGRVHRVAEPGLTFIVPVIDRMQKVSLRIVTMPIQSQGIITRDNVSMMSPGSPTSGSPTRSSPSWPSRASRPRSTSSPYNYVTAVNVARGDMLRDGRGPLRLDAINVNTSANPGTGPPRSGGSW